MEEKGKGNEEEGAQEESASFRRMDRLLAFLVIASVMALQLLICHLSDYRNPKKERGSERNRNMRCSRKTLRTKKITKI